MEMALKAQRRTRFYDDQLDLAAIPHHERLPPTADGLSETLPPGAPLLFQNYNDCLDVLRVIF